MQDAMIEINIKHEEFQRKYVTLRENMRDMSNYDVKLISLVNDQVYGLMTKNHKPSTIEGLLDWFMQEHIAIKINGKVISLSAMDNMVKKIIVADFKATVMQLNALPYYSQYFHKNIIIDKHENDLIIFDGSKQIIPYRCIEINIVDEVIKIKIVN